MIKKFDKLRLAALIFGFVFCLFTLIASYYCAFNVNKFPKWINLPFNAANMDINKTLGTYFAILTFINIIFILVDFKILNDKKKHFWLAIFQIIFCGAIGGILILFSNSKYSDDRQIEQEEVTE